MRILLCGGESFDDYVSFAEALDRIDAATPVTALWCAGLRRLAERWAAMRGVRAEAPPGAGIGPDKQADAALRPDLVLLFPGAAPGELQRALRMGVPVEVYEPARASRA